MNAMPAYVHWLGVAGLKWAGGFWNNWKTGLPSISAIIALIDPCNEIFKAIMDGSVITSLRTAAQTAIGIKYLTRKTLRLLEYMVLALKHDIISMSYLSYIHTLSSKSMIQEKKPQREPLSC